MITDKNELLVTQAKRGDKAALNELFAQNIAEVTGYAKSLTGNYPDADDLVQSAFARALANIATFQTGNFLGWLKTIVRNAFLDEKRQEKSRPCHCDEFPDPATYDEPTGLEQAEERRKLDALLGEAVAAEPVVGQMGLLVLSGENPTYARIAKINTLSKSAIKSRMSRFKKDNADLLDRWQAYFETPVERRSILKSGMWGIASILGFRSLGTALAAGDGGPKDFAMKTLTYLLNWCYPIMRKVHRGTLEDTAIAWEAMPTARQVVKVCSELDLRELEVGTLALVGKLAGSMAGDLGSFYGHQFHGESKENFRLARRCGSLLDGEQRDQIDGPAFHNGDETGMHRWLDESRVLPHEVEPCLRQFDASEKAFARVAASTPDVHGRLGAYGPDGYNARAQTISRIRTLTQAGSSFWPRAQDLIEKANNWRNMDPSTRHRLLVARAKLLELQEKPTDAIPLLQEAGDVLAEFFGDRRRPWVASTVLQRALLGDDGNTAAVDEALFVYVRMGFLNLGFMNVERMRKVFHRKLDRMANMRE